MLVAQDQQDSSLQLRLWPKGTDDMKGNTTTGKKRKKERKEERKKGRKEERKKGRKEERKIEKISN